MIKAKQPYSRFLRNRETLKGARNGLIPHGYKRFPRGMIYTLVYRVTVRKHFKQQTV